jgi:hypothetical protein
MATEDEIIRSYEAEFEPEPPARSNRSFWIVVGTMVAGALFLLVEIFANRPIANTIGHAQDSLRRAEAAAGSIYEGSGSFAGADAGGLEAEVVGLSFRPGSEGSSGLEDVSVSASDTVWAAAVQARPGACFYLRLGVDADPRYGAGTECTGEAALLADDTRW